VGTQVYGFGSYFNDGPVTANDVDFLILHEQQDQKSIDFALECKRILLETIPRADVVILSSSEERHFNFIERARANFLMEVSPISFAQQLSCLFKKPSQ
jgi:hypothetical protein